jgi:hypothetical protein
MMTAFRPLPAASIKPPKFASAAKRNNTRDVEDVPEEFLFPTMRESKAPQEYLDTLRQFDADAMEKLAEIQRNTNGLGHERSVEHGKNNSHIDWLNQERKGILQAELVHKNINPHVSQEARKLFHGLDQAIRVVLREHGYTGNGQSLGNRSPVGMPPRARRHGFSRIG